MSSPRVQGESISPSARLRYATALRAFWAANPTATTTQALDAIRAPRNFTSKIRQKLVKEGVLKGRT